MLISHDCKTQQYEPLKPPRSSASLVCQAGAPFACWPVPPHIMSWGVQSGQRGCWTACAWAPLDCLLPGLFVPAGAPFGACIHILSLRLLRATSVLPCMPRQDKRSHLFQPAWLIRRLIASWQTALHTTCKQDASAGRLLERMLMAWGTSPHPRCSCRLPDIMCRLGQHVAAQR